MNQSCCYGFAVMLVFINFAGSISFDFIFSSDMENFFHVRDFFIDLFVPVLAFFFHFLDG